MDMPWELILSTAFGAIAAYIVPLLGNLPERSKQLILAGLAVVFYGGAWFVVPGLRELTLFEVLQWALQWAMFSLGVYGVVHSTRQVKRYGWKKK